MKLYLKSIWMFIKCELEYRASFILSTVASILSSFFSFLSVIILINKFGAICPDYDINQPYYNSLFCGD